MNNKFSVVLRFRLFGHYPSKLGLVFIQICCIARQQLDARFKMSEIGINYSGLTVCGLHQTVRYLFLHRSG